MVPFVLALRVRSSYGLLPGARVKAELNGRREMTNTQLKSVVAGFSDGFSEPRLL